jgi:hypothetical protein
MIATDFNEETFLLSPQPYTQKDLVLLWEKYKKTYSARTDEDPLYLLSDSPPIFESSFPCFGPIDPVRPEFPVSNRLDPDAFKRSLHHILFCRKNELSKKGVLWLYHDNYKKAAYMLYILPFENVPLHINDRVYWEIAAWRLEIGK